MEWLFDGINTYIMLRTGSLTVALPHLDQKQTHGAPPPPVGRPPIRSCHMCSGQTSGRWHYG